MMISSICIIRCLFVLWLTFGNPDLYLAMHDFDTVQINSLSCTFFFSKLHVAVATALFRLPILWHRDLDNLTTVFKQLAHIALLKVIWEVLHMDGILSFLDTHSCLESVNIDCCRILVFVQLCKLVNFFF